MSLSQRQLRRKWSAEDAADVQRQYERRPMPAVPTADVFPARYRCVRCKAEKDGRFTKDRRSSGGGWDQGQQQPFWYCYECLPFGNGRGEESTAAR